MELRSSWLFPIMVIAAASVMVFGCIGIAAITGHLPAPAARAGVGPLAEAVTAPAQHTVQVNGIKLASEAPLPGAGLQGPAREPPAKAAADAPSKPGAARKKSLQRTTVN